MHTDKAKHLIRYYGKTKFAGMLGINFRTLARRLRENDWSPGHKLIIERESFNLSRIFAGESKNA